MILIKALTSSLKTQAIRKAPSFQRYNNYTSSNCLYSTKSLDLSFTAFQPEKILNANPIIILHGFLGSKRQWKSLAEAIAQRSGRKVYTLDARNHGDSPHSEHFNYNVMCGDVKHFIDSQFLNRTVLIGHCMGGTTAMLLALEEGNLFEKLVLVDISPIKMPEVSASTLTYMAAMKEALDLAENLEINEARKVIKEHLVQSIPKVAIRQYLMTNFEGENKIMWKANIEVLEKAFVTEIYKNSNITGCFMNDTLFISGEESPYVKDKDHPRIKELFPKAEFVAIPGARHWVHDEKPYEFLEALCKFL